MVGSTGQKQTKGEELGYHGPRSSETAPTRVGTTVGAASQGKLGNAILTRDCTDVVTDRLSSIHA